MNSFYTFFSRARQILSNLTKINNQAVSIFYNLYFETREYALPSAKTTESSSIIDTLRNKLLGKLEDWFSFIEIKSQRNITMSLSVFIEILSFSHILFSFSCQNDFPGLVHFVIVDRSRGHICTPTLSIDDNPELSKIHGVGNVLERKVRQNIFSNIRKFSH